jgi:hypothetical protein
MQLTNKVVKVTDLIPHPHNVRKGDTTAIKESLDANGQYRSIVVQKSSSHIIAGNHTYKAAVELGWKEITATIIDVDDESAIRIMLADNRTSELATNDEAALLALLQRLEESTGELLGTGYDMDDLEDLIFKIEGNSGTMSDAPSASERFDDYEARGIKSIILPYEVSEYEDLLPTLAKLRQQRDLETNSQLFAALVRSAAND